jgi:crotonobetainyl-CoA:carnitine CoA-transferase CaiB-like acyl-CoA transferase
MPDALAGVRVVDLTNGFAGNSCAKFLADLGADVVKVESPGRGDFTRTLVPWVFQTFNRNKRSFAVDARTADGRELIHQLIETADVFVQSLRPGAADALGLGLDAVTSRNPRIVYASVSAFGVTGPSSGRKGVDVVIQSESGLSSLQGRVLTNTSFVDASAGLQLTAGILSALLKRERTGVVDHVTINLLDAALYLESVPLAEFNATGKVVDPAAYVLRFPTVGTFEAADGPFFLAAYWDGQWEQLCKLIGRSELTVDVRYATKEDRSANVVALHTELNEEFRRRPRADWVGELDSLEIMSARVNSLADVVADEQVQVNGSFEQLRLADGRDVAFVRPAIRFSRPWPTSRPAPVIGADTIPVLAELGVSDADQLRLRAAGVVEVPADLA